MEGGRMFNPVVTYSFNVRTSLKHVEQFRWAFFRLYSLIFNNTAYIRQP